MSEKLRKNVKLLLLCSIIVLVISLNKVSSFIWKYHSSKLPENCVFDSFRYPSISISQFLQKHPTISNVFVASDSLIIDFVTVSFLYLYIRKGYLSIIYTTLIFYGIRSVALGFGGQWPQPDPFLFKDPGFPSIFVPYEKTNDLYFSGHIGCVTFVFSQCLWYKFKRIGYVAVFGFVWTWLMMTICGGHYSNDLIIGACVGWMSGRLVFRIMENLTIFILKYYCMLLNFLRLCYKKLCEYLGCGERERYASSEQLISV